MTPDDPRHAGALDTAVGQIKTVVADAAERVLNNLVGASQSAARIADRDLLLATQLELRQKGRAFLLYFNQAFDQRVRDDIAPRADTRRTLGAADWQTLSLVDDKEVEEQMFSDRLAQQMSHPCEWELRELAGYLGTLLNFGRAEEDRNPLRPALIGTALYRAIETLTTDRDARRLLAREFGSTMAALMPGCYTAIIADLQQRCIVPVRLSFKGVEGPGNHLSGVNSGYATLQHDDPPSTRSQGSDYHAPYSGHHTGGAAMPGAAGTGFGSVAPAADAQLMSLLRRLTQLASRQGDFDAAPLAARPAAHARRGTPSSPAAWASGSGGEFPALPTLSAAAALGAGSAAAPGTDAGVGLMAVNLIRAHRDELLQASTGKLDHMVIDVVGSLFDQILSDPRVPPQMARQIARLQLPVLRVALVDASFFSSRRHPVRRFVNRIASLACAFDDFSRGPGQQFLARVSEMVQEIVEGDFDSAELYTEKVAELETFIARQTSEQLQGNGAAAVLEGKESELQVQQRYLLQLKAALAPVAMPDYLRAFLCQVWSQALVLAARRDGPESDLSRRLRNVGRDVVMSVQPKGSPPMRKRFLMQLPTLMKDLHEGLALIGWPEAAKKQFLDQLLPSHAESLKGASLTELDYNMLSRQLEIIFATAFPGQSAGQSAGHGSGPAALQEELPRGEPGTALPSAEIEQRFSPQEAAQVGLVAESAVDWAGQVDSGSGVDIDLSADTPDEAPSDPEATTAAVDLGLDIDLNLTATDPADAPSGADLMNHIRLGFAYQMLLKDEWQKVRLTYVSPGRSFFVFSRGREHQETISVTARMLARMCETKRMRAVESAYLMERATVRARKQLAALKASSSAPTTTRH